MKTNNFFFPILLIAVVFFTSCMDNKNINFQSMGFDFNAEMILCNGSGLSFGNCVAKQMKSGICVGIAKVDDTHVAVEIPCEKLMDWGTDTLDIPISEIDTVL